VKVKSLSIHSRGRSAEATSNNAPDVVKSTCYGEHDGEMTFKIDFGLILCLRAGCDTDYG